MKIRIDLPKWCDERHIYIIAGTELAAYLHFGEKKFHIKTSKCNECGKCCMNLIKGHVPLDENKTCVHLGEDGEKKPCTLGAVRPWPCIEGDPVKGKWDGGKDFCSVRYDGDK